MSREDLHDLLTDLAEDVSRTQLVAPALARAHQVRRRRRAAVAAAAAVAVIAAGSVAIWRPKAPAGPPVATGSTSPAPSTTAEGLRIDRLPSVLAPAASTNPDWSRIGSPPVDAPPISAAPLLAASLLFKPYGDPDGPNTVFAYGERPGGAWAWVRLDVELAHTQDAGGNRAIPLDQNSLAPGGRRAAFAQTDEVVIVDLATGDVVRIPVPGLYEEVTWIDDRQVLMSSETTTVRIDAATRAVSSETFRGHSVTPPAGPSVPITTLDGDQNNGPLMLGFPESGTSQRVDTLSARPYQFNALVPRGWRYGNLVAQSAMGHDGKGPADVVFVVNARTGVIRWLLDLGGGRNKGCCPVVGWHGPSEVLVRTEQEGLLVWNLTTGTVSRLAAPISGQMSLDPAPSR